MTSTTTRLLTGAAAALCLSGAMAQALPLASGASSVLEQARTVAMLPVEQVQYYYGGPGYYAGPRYYGRPAYGSGPGYYRRGYRGDGIAAGVAAGAIGALAIGGLAASGAFDPPVRAAPMAPGRRQWCADRYRSYNPEDGTFIGRDGRVRFCG